MRILRIYAGMLVALSCVFSPSCKHEIDYPDANPNPTDTTGNPIDTTTPPPVDTIVCFESEILPLFVSNCAMSGCHDALTQAEEIQLTSYGTIRPEVSPFHPNSGDVMESILDGSMPPNPYSNLTTTQITLIQQWINQGAQNTTNCANTCDSTAFKYAADIAPIMSTFCNGCHGGSFPSAGINTSTWSGLQASVTNGSLLGSVQHTGGFSFMPKGTAMMDECNITKIRKWIQAGAINN